MVNNDFVLAFGFSAASKSTIFNKSGHFEYILFLNQ